jgi:predicted TIM-barrel fold metal-dependent hydrolase
MRAARALVGGEPMTADGNRVLDSDMHVVEPADLWQRYIDPAYRHAAPVGLSEMRRDIRVRVKSQVMLRIGRVGPMVDAGRSAWRPEHDDAYARAEARGWDPTSQLEAMEREGLDVAVLFPSRGLFVLGLDLPQVVGPDGLEPPFAAAIARAYNDWLHDFCAAAPERMFGAGMIAPHDVESAVVEARRCVERFGFKAVFLPSGCVGRRPWYDPYYDPLWAECQRLDVPIAFHGGGQTCLKPDYSLEVLDRLMLWHTFNQPIGIMATTASLTAGGVLERFPRLRVALLEGNCSWAPWLMHRLDEHYEWAGTLDGPELRLKPSEYFRRNCFLSVESDEVTVSQYVDWFGDDNLLFSTDYPHADSQYPNVVKTFLELPLSDASKRKIMWDNSARLYHLPQAGTAVQA